MPLSKAIQIDQVSNGYILSLAPHAYNQGQANDPTRTLVFLTKEALGEHIKLNGLEMDLTETRILDKSF